MNVTENLQVVTAAPVQQTAVEQSSGSLSLESGGIEAKGQTSAATVAVKQ